MLIIFVSSSQTKAQIPDFGGYDWSVKKSGHLFVYAALALAIWRGLSDGRAPRWRTGLVVLLAATYGATDELHQSFVAGRGASVVDVFIDLVGAGLGAAVAGYAATGRRRLRAAIGGRGKSDPA